MEKLTKELKMKMEKNLIREELREKINSIEANISTYLDHRECGIRNSYEYEELIDECIKNIKDNKTILKCYEEKIGDIIGKKSPSYGCSGSYHYEYIINEKLFKNIDEEIEKNDKIIIESDKKVKLLEKKIKDIKQEYKIEHKVVLEND